MYQVLIRPSWELNHRPWDPKTANIWRKGDFSFHLIAPSRPPVARGQGRFQPRITYVTLAMLVIGFDSTLDSRILEYIQGISRMHCACVRAHVCVCVCVCVCVYVWGGMHAPSSLLLFFKIQVAPCQCTFCGISFKNLWEAPVMAQWKQIWVASRGHRFDPWPRSVG